VAAPTALDAAAPPAAAVHPASYAQERVWLAGQIAHGVPVYHVSDELAVHALVTPRQLGEAVAAIVARHEALRTAFRLREDRLEQLVLPAVRIESAVSFVDLRGLDEAEQAARRRALAERLVFEPFDLARAPLWRAAAVHLDEGRWAVQFVAHHAVCDTASVFNFYAELTELCAAAEGGRAPKLPELTASYTAYSARQRARLAGAGRVGPARYWSARLAGLAPVHGVPLDRPRPVRRAFAGADLRADLPRPVISALPHTARALDATPFMVLLAAYAALLRHRSGRDEIVVGVPAAGREDPRLLPLIGTFVNMLVLRVDVGGEPSFADLVDRVRAHTRGALRHQELPFQQLVELLPAPRPAGAAPLYQLGFNLAHAAGFGPPSQTAEDDLLLEVAEDRVRLEYRTDLFDRATAAGLLADYVEILGEGLADPARPIGAARPARRAGPAVAQRAAGSARPAYLAPRTASEAMVVQAWQEALGVARVGVHDEFFALGGHSAQALRVLAALARCCGVRPSIQDFFADTTAAALAARLDRLIAGRA
jgi:hypothetical protein